MKLRQLRGSGDGEGIQVTIRQIVECGKRNNFR